MADIKISELPVASVVDGNDIVVLNQGTTTKTATKDLVVAGLATTGQLSGLATTSQLSGLATTSQISGFATTGQLSGFTNSAQVEALASAQIAAITPASIGAFATSAIIAIENGGTGALNANDALTNLGAIPTSQQAGGDLSGQLTAPNVVKLYGNAISQLTPSGGQVLRWSGTEWEPSNGNNGTVTSITVGSELMVDGIPGGTLTESGTIGLSGTGFPAGSYGSSTQVAAITFNGFGQITSASNEAITPAGIGAFATSAIIGIGNGGTGATDAPSALAALGGITSAQVPAFDSAQLSAYVLKAGSTMDGRLIMAATTAQAKANIGGAIGAASPSSIAVGDVWVSNQSKLTFSPSTGVAVALAGTSQTNTFNQAQTIGVGGTVNALTVNNSGTGRAATFTAASSSAAVSILQTGAGEAFRVEDETSPDTTPFVISASGRVGIGVTPDAVTALAVDSGGIKFGDGSIQTSAIIAIGSGGTGSTDAVSALAALGAAPLASPAFTGTPTAPTAAAQTNTTQVATTAFVLSNSGDRYLTTSTTSNTITNGAKTFTVASGLSYTATQDITIVYDVNNHMHGSVTSYSGTTLVVDIVQHSQTSPGPYTQWTINVGGLTNTAGTLLSANNLSDVASPSTSLTNLGGVSTARTISAGTGLSGGGDLTADRTLSLADTAVTAGSYGSSTQIAALTVDAQGRLTAASNQAITPAGIGAQIALTSAAPLAIDKGGTGATSAAAALSNLGGITSDSLSGFAVTSQLSAFTNSAQVQSLASAQIAAITPASIGAFSTNAVIAIGNGGTGATDAPSALSNLGALSATAPAGGDLSGSYPNPTVAKIQGNTVSSSTPLSGQALVYNGTEWAPATASGSGTVTSVTAGGGLTGGTITASGTIALSTTGPGVITAGSSAAVPVITLDEYGRISALSTAPISGGGGGGTGEGMQFAVVRHGTQVVPASAGTVNVSAWANAATTINFSATPSFTLVPGMVLNVAGLNTIAIRTVVSPTQVILATGATAAGSATSNVTVQNTTTTTFTVTAGALPAYDGRTLQLNDVVFLTQQGATGGSTPSAQNGPWIVTTLGATGVSAVFTRPSWFTGTLSGPRQVGIQGGTGSFGFTFSIAGNIASNTSYLVGVDPLLALAVAQRASFALTNAANTFTQKQTFAANTTTVNPFSFASTASQTLLTSVALGAVEWDNQQMYVTSSTPAAGLTRNPIATSMVPINNQTASYPLVLADAGKMIVVNSASATTVTIPLQSTANFPIGTQILVMQIGSAQTSIAATSGVTLNGKNGVTTSGPYAVISLIKIGADSWVVAGDATV